LPESGGAVSQIAQSILERELFYTLRLSNPPNLKLQNNIKIAGFGYAGAVNGR
jgi:hypothetical protein